MLPFTASGRTGPCIVLLHWLGGGAQTWTETTERLTQRGLSTVAIDLPGFGAAAGIAGYTLQAMAEAVIATLDAAQIAERPWLLAGHSMGGKVAAIVARRALSGVPALANLRGLIFVSASPPSPEPMPGNKRAQLLESLGQPTAHDQEHAARFVDDNTGKLPLLPAVRNRASAGVLAMNRTAFRHWLEYGSKEDWSDRVGVLPLPAIVFAGTEDAALGPEAQRDHLLPHLPNAELVSLEGCGHLSPLERPGELAERITNFLSAARLDLPASEISPAFTGLLHSERVSPATRTALEERLTAAQHMAAQQRSGNQSLLTTDDFLTLRALVGRVIPLAGFDLASVLTRQLASREADGWRFEALPPDLEAWRIGLLSLNRAALHAYSVPFLALHDAQQDELLHRAAGGKLAPTILEAIHLAPGPQPYSATQMKLWFEDVRAECAGLYIADPRTMEHIGFTGFADDLGFTQIQLGQKEAFEQ